MAAVFELICEVISSRQSGPISVNCSATREVLDVVCVYDGSNWESQASCVVCTCTASRALGFPIDSGRCGAGTHTLVVSAVSTDGQRASSTVFFNISHG